MVTGNVDGMAASGSQRFAPYKLACLEINGADIAPRWGDAGNAIAQPGSPRNRTGPIGQAALRVKPASRANAFADGSDAALLDLIRCQQPDVIRQTVVVDDQQAALGIDCGAAPIHAAVKPRIEDSSSFDRGGGGGACKPLDSALGETVCDTTVDRSGSINTHPSRSAVHRPRLACRRNRVESARSNRL